MGVSRRRILVAATALPAAVAAGRVLGTVGDIAAGAIAAIRPACSGTTATRCAQCGSPDHTMLDARCPAAPKVLS